MRKQYFLLKWLVVIGVFSAAAYYVPGLLHSDTKQAGTQGATPVSVAAVLSRPVTRWHEFSGLLQAVDSVEIRPRIGGQITAIHFSDGAEVKKGQPLFTIDPRPYAAEVTRAKGSLAAAQAAYDNAAQEAARAAKLIKGKAISQSEFETRSAALKQSAGALESARGTLTAAEINHAYTHITSPISGKISRAEISVGNLVDAGANALLLASIVALSPIYASFDVDEQTFLKTIKGVPAAKLKTIPVKVGLGNEEGTSIDATIHSFDNQLAPGSGTIRVRAAIANKNGALIPGLYARVKLGTPDMNEVLLIHPTAVGTDQNKKFVMVVDADSKAQYREVMLDAMADGMQIVLSGLTEGERIIVGGLQRVRPGALVTGTAVDMTTLAPLSAAATAAEAAQ